MTDTSYDSEIDSALEDTKPPSSAEPIPDDEERYFDNMLTSEGRKNPLNLTNVLKVIKRLKNEKPLAEQVDAKETQVINRKDLNNINQQLNEALGGLEEAYKNEIEYEIIHQTSVIKELLAQKREIKKAQRAGRGAF